MEATLSISLRLYGAATTSSVNDRINRVLNKTLSSLAKVVVQDISLTAGEADHIVDFGEITTATSIFIFADYAVSAKWNAIVTAVPSGKVIVLSDGSAITSLKLSNLDLVNANAVNVVLVS